MHSPRPLVWISAILLLIFVSFVLAAQAQDVNRVAPKQLVFSAMQGTKGILYKVDNMAVSDPLRGLGKAIEKYGDDFPVVCLIDSRLPVRLIGEAFALAGKAGFTNVRTFAVDHGSGKVSEVKFGPWMTAPN